MAERLFSLLGLAQRSGRLASGHQAVEQLLARGGCGLLIVAGDAAVRTRHGFMEQARRGQVPVLVISEMSELGFAVGQSPRALVAVMEGPLVEEIRRAGADLGGVVCE
ncbi:MAG: ribosomal L7Ae/L30e/S12e/Gadd45 family protein [Thermaerobacterales bacterium]